MSKLYESTRNKMETITPSKAILQGLSTDGGLFVLRDLKEQKIDVNSLVEKDYYGIAQEILKLFVDDFSDEEIKNCVYHAYQDKFTNEEITPLVELSDVYVLELFNGPTSAFKDVGLSMLPQLTSTALKKTNADYDILILTATSGDTGKAALEGFKDVPKTKIMVFYPNEGVSKVQEMQMKTQEGKNLKVCAINGNFDDAQSGIKKLFVDEDFKAELAKDHVRLSSANSINIGRLVPQIVYYFYAYVKLVEKGAIKVGEEINFVVPTGNFGNILAGYYAKQIGLPIHKLVCASNDNNVLYDFINTGTYDRKRSFLKTISPSMDILISSNLERLLYYASDCDNEYISELMNDLNTNGSYKVKADVLQKIQADFSCGFASNQQTAETIKKVYEKDKYLLDPHTAVAYKVLLDEIDVEHKNVVLSTASPYKFTDSVYGALHGENGEDEFVLMEKLYEETNVAIPTNLKDLDKKPILHKDLIKKENMKEYIKEKVKEI
ncbi:MULTISPECIES: threonine synthase [unclassified Breznakia]|uniref:threonine synthase n=1 Tax=unclassified Breznakia TaxID=2623764 RepID=UPI002406D7E2|nr:MULTISPECIES: threonine synthase [unclassified Breznakia]MDF9837633.1 threonine synthase [Breznakia sp. PFB2-8]MDF9859497.1 threonine synthase [Breznakia sp. PH5-24]